jgi:epoxyqueuosine reductase
LETLTEIVKQIACEKGASLVGIADISQLVGPVCSDPTYLLPETKSVVVFAININHEIIRNYLSKKSFASKDAMSRHEGEIYHSLWQIGMEISKYLEKYGYKAINAWPNKDYREHKSGSDKSNPFGFTPEFSHRYAAVAAGLGSFGWSSNVVTKEYGATVYFSSVLTSASLRPDSPLTINPCDNCKLCAYACQSEFIQKDADLISFTLGNSVFSHGKTQHVGRCSLCCGGWVNQYQHQEWSTFSSICVDFTFPADSDEFRTKFREMVVKDLKGSDSRAKRNILHHIKLGNRGMHETELDEYEVVCGYCQLICFKDREDRVLNLKMLRSSGVVTEDGDYEYIIRDGSIVDKRKWRV